MSRLRRWSADLGLIITVLVWGTTFALMKDALEGIHPFNFIFLRFSLATVVLALVNWRHLSKMNLRLLKLGFYLGLALTAGFVFQVSGLAYTTASKAGFITGLSVLIVPIITIIVSKKLPSIPILIGVGLAMVGLLLLSYDGQWVFNYGDVLVFFCALGFGVHIFLVGEFVQNQNPALLTMIQIGVVAVIAGCLAGIKGELHFSYPPKIWWGIIYMAVVATGMTFFIQNWAQQFTSAVRTAIIFSMEPVFALMFAVILLAEPVTPQGLWGGGLIITGMLFAEVGGQQKKYKKVEEWER